MKPTLIATDNTKLQKTIDIYQDITRKLNLAYVELKKISPKITADDIVALCSHNAYLGQVRATEALRKKIQNLYVESQGHNYTGLGLDLNRLIELKAVNLPNIDRALASIIEAILAIQRLKGGPSSQEALGFYYPLIGMFDGNEFYLPEETIEMARVFYSRYITTPDEQEVFTAFEAIASETNKLMAKGLISPENFVEDIFRKLSGAFKKQGKQLVTSEKAFWHFEKLGTGRIAKKTSFEQLFDPDPFTD